MDLGLEKKRIFISASSGGIGFAIARTFIKEGATVVINGRNSEELEKRVQELQGNSSRDNVYGFVGDMSDAKTIDEAAIFVKNLLGGVDAVVCNLGSGKPNGPNKWSRMEWQRLIDVNLLSAISLIETFLPYFDEKGGSIMMLSSLAGLSRIGAPPAYAASKSAINSVVSYAAKEFAEKNIRINAIAPGNVYFEGGRWEELKKNDEKGTLEYINSEVPMKRFARPEEIADVAVFVCSDRASFITGEVISVDGGQKR